ncbi:MAG TPA: MraY family glycosyltransferase [Chitinophagaceae bacterium]|nr:MraY family glycosyltransferase [Chitinophagaceae bacterium]
MKNHLLQINLFDLHLGNYKYGLLCLLSAFVVSLILIPIIIRLINKYNIYDMPNARKEHAAPIPTMGGIAIVAGMFMALLLWFPFANSEMQISFFFAVIILFALGMLDDLKDISATYKFVVQLALAFLMAVAGLRITSFEGLFGIYDLPVMAQYSFTVLTIVGITNAFNLIDGIDGLAGGLGFMSLITLGIFLTLSGDINFAMLAFALAGALLGFLYFNMNPAKIFMGDTGSLVLGFVTAVLCLRLIAVNQIAINPDLPKATVFVLGIVLIPVFDTLRVFATRIRYGQSPFAPDKTHIHHLLTNQGFSHGFTTRFICFLHGFILIESYWLIHLRPVFGLAILICFMVLITGALKYAGLYFPQRKQEQQSTDFV